MKSKIKIYFFEIVHDAFEINEIFNQIIDM